jgi:hypothetical protein
MTTNLADLQSALSLLTSVSSSQNSNKTSSGNDAASSNSTSTSNPSASTISGIVDQARSSAQNAGQLWSLQVADSASTSSNTGGGDQTLSSSQSPSGAITLHAADGLVSSSAQGDLLAYDPQMVDYANLFVSENSMTSQQLTDAAYAGGGLGVIDGAGTSDVSFADVMEGEIEGAGLMLANATALQTSATQAMSTGNAPGSGAPSNSGDTPEQDLATANSVIAEAQQHFSEFNQVMNAYNDHTLNIQNAIDVQGLDYSESYTANEANGSGTSSLSLTQNNSFLTNNTDGQQHLLVQWGYTAVYLSW